MVQPNPLTLFDPELTGSVDTPNPAPQTTAPPSGL